MHVYKAILKIANTDQFWLGGDEMKIVHPKTRAKSCFRPFLGDCIRTACTHTKPLVYTHNLHALVTLQQR